MSESPTSSASNSPTNFEETQQATESSSSGAASNPTLSSMAKPKRRRRKEISYIGDKSKRNVCFQKRKKGILKKAQELCVLTGCHMLCIVASDDDVQTFSTFKLRPLLTTDICRNVLEDSLGTEKDHLRQVVEEAILKCSQENEMDDVYGDDADNYSIEYYSKLSSKGNQNSKTGVARKASKIEWSDSKAEENPQKRRTIRSEDYSISTVQNNGANHLHPTVASFQQDPTLSSSISENLQSRVAHQHYTLTNQKQQQQQLLQQQQQQQHFASHTPQIPSSSPHQQPVPSDNHITNSNNNLAKSESYPNAKLVIKQGNPTNNSTFPPIQIPTFDTGQGFGSSTQTSSQFLDRPQFHVQNNNMNSNPLLSTTNYPQTMRQQQQQQQHHQQSNSFSPSQQPNLLEDIGKCSWLQDCQVPNNPSNEQGSNVENPNGMTDNSQAANLSTSRNSGQVNLSLSTQQLYELLKLDKERGGNLLDTYILQLSQGSVNSNSNTLGAGNNHNSSGGIVQNSSSSNGQSSGSRLSMRRTSSISNFLSESLLSSNPSTPTNDFVSTLNAGSQPSHDRDQQQ